MAKAHTLEAWQSLLAVHLGTASVCKGSWYSSHGIHFLHRLKFYPDIYNLRRSQTNCSLMSRMCYLQIISCFTGEKEENKLTPTLHASIPSLSFTLSSLLMVFFLFFTLPNCIQRCVY